MKQEKIKDTLYIKILIWAYEKQEAGFDWEELKSKFQLNPAKNQWVTKIFLDNLPLSDNLISHLSYVDESKKHLYVITAKGSSAAIEYLNLEEAKKVVNEQNLLQLLPSS